MNDTLNEALESAVTDGLTEEKTEEVSDEKDSSKDEQTDESKATKDDSTKESQDKDESADESEKSDDSKEDSEKEDSKEDEESEDTKEDEAKEDDKETFTKVDPNELPDEVKPVYKSLLADYTRKRQQEAQTVRDLQDEVKGLKTQIAGGVQQQPGKVEIGLTKEQIGEMGLEEYTQHVINQTHKSNLASRQTEDVTKYEQDATTGFLALDARLNPDIETSYDSRFANNIGNKVDADHAEHITKTGSPLGFDYKSSAEKHIKEWDEWVSGIKKESVKKSAVASKQKAKKLRKSAPPTSSAKSKTSGNMGLGGAIGAAFDEHSDK